MSKRAFLSKSLAIYQIWEKKPFVRFWSTRCSSPLINRHRSSFGLVFNLQNNVRRRLYTLSWVYIRVCVPCVHDEISRQEYNSSCIIANALDHRAFKYARTCEREYSPLVSQRDYSGTNHSLREMRHREFIRSMLLRPRFRPAFLSRLPSAILIGFERGHRIVDNSGGSAAGKKTGYHSAYRYLVPPRMRKKSSIKAHALIHNTSTVFNALFVTYLPLPLFSLVSHWLVKRTPRNTGPDLPAF